MKGIDRVLQKILRSGKVVNTLNLKGSDREHDVPIFILQAANTLNLKGNDRLVLSHQSQTPRILKGGDRQNEDYFLNLEGIDRNRSLYFFYWLGIFCNYLILDFIFFGYCFSITNSSTNSSRGVVQNPKINCPARKISQKIKNFKIFPKNNQQISQNSK